MKTSTKIAAVVLASDEEEIIGECLRSLQWVDSIYIINPRRNKRLVDEERKFTRNIYFHNFVNDFSKQRNYALGKVRSDWILVLDADERISDRAEKVIRKLIQDDSVDGYWFPRRNYINDRIYLEHGYFYPDWQLRLFRNLKEYRYSGVIHEQIQVPKSKTKYIKDIELHHNSLHTKYNTFFSFHRLYPYIKIEGKNLSRSDESSLKLLIEGILDIIKHFYRSFLKFEGYKDGYNGFRAACIYATYRGLVKFSAIFYR